MARFETFEIQVEGANTKTTFFGSIGQAMSVAAHLCQLEQKTVTVRTGGWLVLSAHFARSSGDCVELKIKREYLEAEERAISANA